MPFPSPREQIALRPVDGAAVAKLAADLNVPIAAATILVGRGLTTFDRCKAYFRPNAEDGFLDPFIFKDMDKAVKRITAAIASGEKILVYGDYDVDGVTATALLTRVLKRLGANCGYYLPNRLTEGYGISETGIRHAAENGFALIISVDCGVTACDEAGLAASLGVDMIITDHHEPKEALPAAVALINPKLHNCGYPDKALAGVGIALKLCQALAKAAGRGNGLWSDLIELAALGTAADIVPMTGENRVITALGFARIPVTEIVGLRALVEAQGLKDKTLSTGQVVFQLAPCINAVGRLGDPRRGAELLLTADAALAGLYARELKEANMERRALDSLAAEEAFKWVDEHCAPETDCGLVVASPDWHVGVIGIVASKVVERYNRPAILISIGEDGAAKGSGRSVPDLHLLQALDECADVLDAYGGHAAAAGLSLRAEKIDAFRNRFNEVVKSKLSGKDLALRVTADAEAPIDQLTPKLLRIIKQMEPFGPGNMRPVLLTKGLKHRYTPKTVGQKHLKMSLTDGKAVMDAIAFGMGERLPEVSAAKTLDVAFGLEDNEWNGKVSLQMNVKGIAVGG
ncbi:MAG: single-stranded-DNA-specific exonuclease RecJ [Chitinispirillales bacterium]|jgi:single-stranded-DNA-specific exonuclease|nr:single-stranded-DNA-specific exonuclease RecJ [Chitinispirillales bacterium]